MDIAPNVNRGEEEEEEAVQTIRAQSTPSNARAGYPLVYWGGLKPPYPPPAPLPVSLVL